MRKILVILSLFLIVGCSKANDDLLEVFNKSKSKIFGNASSILM